MSKQKSLCHGIQDFAHGKAISKGQISMVRNSDIDSRVRTPYQRPEYNSGSAISKSIRRFRCGIVLVIISLRSRGPKHYMVSRLSDVVNNWLQRSLSHDFAMRNVKRRALARRKMS